MQCPSCQFENMPGRTQCGRCGSMLSGGQVAIDVLPPRASRRQKWLRKNLVSFSWNKEVFGSLRQWLRTRLDPQSTVNVHVTESGVILRMIVPGWPHFYCGWPLWGRIFLSSYLLLMVMSALVLGTPFAGLFFGAAVSVHAASNASLFRSPSATPMERIATSIICILVISVGIYLPLATAIHNVTHPMVLNINSPPFKRGDTFLTSPVTSETAFERGQVVVFVPQQLNIAQLGRIYRIDGLHVDRIIAVSGDHVSATAGKISINGEMSSFQPLNDGFRVPDFELTVPNGSFLIFPSSETVLNSQASSNVLSVSNVPRQRLNSVIYFRVAPFYRMGWID